MQSLNSPNSSATGSTDSSRGRSRCGARVVAFSEERGDLIEQAGLCPHPLVLDSRADLREFETRRLGGDRRRARSARGRERDLERRRGGEAAAARHPAGDVQPSTGRRRYRRAGARRRHRARTPASPRSAGSSARRRRGLEIGRDGLDAARVESLGADRHASSYRGGEGQSEVVVRVLPDEVDPSGSKGGAVDAHCGPVSRVARSRCCQDGGMSVWSEASSFATGAGTLVLAVATFASVRSANRSARTAEQALQEARRPVLVHSQLRGPGAEDRLHRCPLDKRRRRSRGGRTPGRRHLSGHERAQRRRGHRGASRLVARPGVVRADVDPAPEEDVHLLSRDLYVPAGDIGIWQGALRDPGTSSTEPCATSSKAVSRSRSNCTTPIASVASARSRASRSRLPATKAGWPRWAGISTLTVKDRATAGTAPRRKRGHWRCTPSKP